MISDGNKQIFKILLIAFLFFLIGINWGLPHAISPETVEPWGVDTIAPVAPLSEAYHKFTRSNNNWTYYPLFHYIVIDIAYAPYIAYQYLKGNLKKPSSDFPYGFKNPKNVLMHLTLIARFISLIMALGIVFLVYKITEELFSRKAALWASLFTIFTPSLIFYSTTSNPDVPYIFWSFLAFWQIIKIIKYQKFIYYIIFSISVALAVATKDQAYGFFVFVPFILIFSLVYQKKENENVNATDLINSLFSRQIVLSFLLVILVYGLANNLFFGGYTGFINRLLRYQQNFQLNWQENSSGSLFYVQVSHFLKYTNLVIRTLGPGTLLMSIFGISLSVVKKDKLSLMLLIFPLSYYFFCVAAIGVVAMRTILVPAIIITPFAANFIEKYLKKTGLARRLLIAGIFISLVWQLALTANLAFTLFKDSRYQAESWIKDNIPVGSIIETNVKEKFLPHISDNYQMEVKGVELNKLIPGELNQKSLKERNPEYILLITGLGVSGDPLSFKDKEIENYFTALIEGRFDYTLLAKFETPSFLSYRQIIATKPTCFILKKDN